MNGEAALVRLEREAGLAVATFDSPPLNPTKAHA